ncbi:unannotated protein [freshwater metagenome]|uniref:Unannotated protein n=1 Tax=freshwater metagenome TaxID=449393 RepID=A0A6J7J0X9_9ZZZZ
MNVADALVDALLIDIGENHRHLQLAHEQQRELAGHQTGTDDADTGDLAGERLVGRTGGTLRALLNQVEGVQTGTQLVLDQQRRQRVVLGRERLVERRGIGDVGVLGQLEQVDGSDRSRCEIAGLAGHDAPGTGDGVVPGLPAVDLGTVGDDLALDDLSGPRERLLEEVGSAEEGVGDAEVECLLRLEDAVLVQCVLDDDGDRVRGPDDVGQQLSSAPSRYQAEEGLG